jgi:hypothetical protein
METFLSDAVVVEGALFSFLLALWMTWMGLRGLFRLMPIMAQPITVRVVQPIRFFADRQEANRRSNAA